MAGLWSMLQHKWHPPAEPKDSFANKTVIVTGSNTGLGFQAALKFVKLDASLVILGVRNLEKGLQAKSEIEAQTGKKDRVEVWNLDMDSYDSITEFAHKAAGLERLDVVILNAGVFMVGYQESKYGWEETLQVNTLSTAFLGLLLLRKLKSSRKVDGLPVLEIVASGNHERVEIDEGNRQAENLLKSYSTPDHYVTSKQYAISKLFVMYVMQTLANLAKSPSLDTTGKDSKIDVLVTSVCPGFCASDLSRGYSSLLFNVLRPIMFTLFTRTTEQGSRTLVSGVTLGEEAHGRFWQHDQIKAPVPLVSGKQGEELRERVWGEIVEALANDVPEVRQSIVELKQG